MEVWKLILIPIWLFWILSIINRWKKHEIIYAEIALWMSLTVFLAINILSEVNWDWLFYKL